MENFLYQDLVFSLRVLDFSCRVEQFGPVPVPATEGHGVSRTKGDSTVAKKYQTVGPYDIRCGKDPDDPDSERGWRVFEDGDAYNWNEVYDSEDEAVDRANELWAEVLQEEITNSLPDDVDVLQAILKLINDET